MRGLVLVIFTQFVLTTDGAQFVKYLLSHGEVPSSKGIGCVIKSLQSAPTAYRIEAASGDCLSLGSDWLAAKTFLNGYSYIEPDGAIQTPSTTTTPGQTTTRGPMPAPITQVFTEPNPIGETSVYDPNKERVWAIPGQHGIGGSVELYFTSPTVPGTWKKLDVRFQEDLDGLPFSTTDDVADELLLKILLSNETNLILFKSHDQVNGWTNMPSSVPDFEMGRTYKLTINARETYYQILLDDVERSTVPYIKSPEAAKVIVFKYMNTENIFWPWIENITFCGTW